MAAFTAGTFSRWETSYVLGVVCTAILTGSAHVVGASPEARDRVVIRVYNAIGIPEASLARALPVAVKAIERAGIQAGWRNCVVGGHPTASASDPCEDLLDGDEVVVRIISAPTSGPGLSTIPADTLGFSYVDSDAASGVLATVYADRVLTMAARAGGDFPRLLGNTIAHEVGHLLLGTPAHASTGLMRALWADAEVERYVDHDWTFSKAEASAMRRNLAARRRMNTRPGLVTADGGARTESDADADRR